jgi:hypothetical protein
MLKKLCGGLKLIVSYADIDQNHHGGIYQATNWIYTGARNQNTVSAFIINGKKTHRKSIHSIGVRQSIKDVKKFLDPKAQVFITKGKHCYLMPLCESIEKDILKLSKPYPKRVSSVNSSMSTVHVEGSGANPTDTLQEYKTEVTHG